MASARSKSSRALTKSPFRCHDKTSCLEGSCEGRVARRQQPFLDGQGAIAVCECFVVLLELGQRRGDAVERFCDGDRVWIDRCSNLKSALELPSRRRIVAGLKEDVTEIHHGPDRAASDLPWLGILRN